MLEGVLVDETIEVLFKCARDFAWSPRTRPIHEARHALVSKALHPFAEGGVGKMEGCRDRVDVVACDDLTDGLRAAKDPGFLRLLEHSL